MAELFTLPGSGLIVAEVEAHPNGVSGAGRAEFAMLTVWLKMVFHCPAKSIASCLDFRELRCRVSPFEGMYIGISEPAFLNEQVRSKEVRRDQTVILEIPLDHRRIAHINELRKGGDVRLRLDLELFTDELVECNLQSSLFGLVRRHRLQSKLNVNIPRSIWVQQILPGIEFDKVHIIELPSIPINSCESVRASFEALQQAVKLEREGFFNEAVAKCRIALEPFFEMVDKPDEKGVVRKVPQLITAWQTRLGQRTYEWLNSSFSVLKQATNQPHHLSSRHYDQLEAQMLMTVATAVLAYAVRVENHKPVTDKTGV